MAANKLLLVEDVENLGRSGDIVTVKPGYARNRLLPAGLAVVADKRAMRIQERLQEERKKKAEDDRKESELLAKKIEGQTLSKSVKVDNEGHLYGSVSAADVQQLLNDLLDIQLDKKCIQLKQPLKKLGTFTIHLSLKESVECAFTLKVVSEASVEEGE